MNASLNQRNAVEDKGKACWYCETPISGICYYCGKCVLCENGIKHICSLAKLRKKNS